MHATSFKSDCWEKKSDTQITQQDIIFIIQHLETLISDFFLLFSTESWGILLEASLCYKALLALKGLENSCHLIEIFIMCNYHHEVLLLLQLFMYCKITANRYWLFRLVTSVTKSHDCYKTRLIRIDYIIFLAVQFYIRLCLICRQTMRNIIHNLPVA